MSEVQSVSASAEEVNKQDKDDKPPLFHAIANNDLPLVEQLLSQGADITHNTVNRGFKRTPLHEAAHKCVDDSHFRVIEVLLKNGADPNAQDFFGQTPLFCLVEQGNVKSVQLFCDSKADFKAVDTEGWTLLFPAVFYNENLEMLRLLINLGLDVKHCSNDNTTALHHAAKNNEGESHFEILELLLKSGADVNARDKYGYTALSHVIENADIKTVRLLLDSKAEFYETDDIKSESIFTSIFSSEKQEILQLMLDRGLLVKYRSTSKKTPLHFAATVNRGESRMKVLLELLLKDGADVNARDELDETPLWHLVKNKGSVRVVQLFLDFQADANAQNNVGSNLFSTVFEHNFENEEVAKLLMNHGLDINNRCSKGMTPLHIEYRNTIDNNVRNMKFLLKHGALTNLVDRDELTPFTAAVRDYNSAQEHDEKTAKKKLKFIIDHTDFKLTENSRNILDDKTVPIKRCFNGMVIDHVAKLHALSLPVHQDLVSTIFCKKEYCDYYEQCSEELLRTKSTKLHTSWITFYNLLVDSKKKLKNYAGNEEMVEYIEKSEWLEKYPIYGASMQENVKKGTSRRKLFDKSTVLLSYYLPIFNPTHLVVRDVLDCVLSKKDLSKFCQETLRYNFQLS